MPSRLRAAAMSLAELLAYCARFSVPEYQRVYAWGEAEINRLISDLARAVQRKDRQFFLGTIYLAMEGGSQDALIADGQQRLLTANMVYACARDLTGDAAQAAKLHALVAAPSGGGFRFTPRGRDADFFRQWVQERGATLVAFTGEAEADGEEADPEAPLSESQTNIIRNRDRIRSWLEGLGDQDRRELLAFHEQAIDVVVIVAPTLEEARTAYASTQSRGLRQSEADTLKAELIGDCAPGLRARLAGQWEECEATLGREDLTELLQQMVAVKSERRANVALDVDLFAVFELPRNVESFIEQELVPSAQAYARLCANRTTGRSADLRTSAHLVTLMRTTHKSWKAPALLALRLLHANPAALEAFMRNLERLAAVLMINGTDPGERMERYSTVVRGLKSGQRENARGLKVSKRERAQARAKLVETEFGRRNRMRTALLLKLNDCLGKTVLAIEPKAVTCEHVLPRNLSKDSPWHDHFSGKERAACVNRLGNLALLSHRDNRLVDVAPFAGKKGTLKRSPYALAKDASRERVWNAKTVLDRTERLAQILIKHWRLADGDDD